MVYKRLVNDVKIPFDFRFEFPNERKSKDSHFIVRPQQGVIPGFQSIRIEFIFEPKTPTTETLEIIFFLNELNFVPLKVEDINVSYNSWGREATKIFSIATRE